METHVVIGPQKPFVAMQIAGRPSGLSLGSLREFSYRDVHHAAVDDISFKIADPRGLWRGSWGIDEGTEISATMGYVGGLQVPCGLYAVDEVEASGDDGGDIAVFKCLSAFTSKGLRTERSEAYDDMSAADIVGRVAARHGLSVTGQIPDLRFERISQNKQSDLSFLTRLANDWGCYFSVKGAQLVFTTRESIERAEPVRVFDLDDGGLLGWRVRKSTHKLYRRAVARYFHPIRKSTLTAEVEDPRVVSGDTLKIDERCETLAHAERLCIARLARENDGLGTGSLTTVGDPLLLAGQVIALAGGFGRFAGTWLVSSARHHFGSNGYTTQIQIKLVE